MAFGATRRLRSRIFVAALGLASSATGAVHSPDAPTSSPAPLFPGLTAPPSETPSPEAEASPPHPVQAPADSASTPAPESQEAPAIKDAPAAEQVPSTPAPASSVPPQETSAETAETETSSVPAAQKLSAAPCAEAPPQEKEKLSPFKSLLLLEAVGRYGLLGRGSGLLDSETEEPIDETFTAGYFGGQATFGLMPSHSAFTLAARLRGGSYIGGGLSAGSLGAAVLFGANFARNESGDSFSYALGGFGVEFMPAANTDMLTFNASGGTIMNGFNLSAGLDLGINDDLFVAFFGLQLGWGQLFK